MPVPFYENPGFYAVIVSIAAIILSQMPPIYLLFRARRLDAEVHSRLGVTHMFGNLNLTLMVLARNAGGRELLVRKMGLSLFRDGKLLGEYPSQQYFETPASTSPFLLVPFSIKPDERWIHPVVFFNTFDRNTEKVFRRHITTLQDDIRNKLAARKPENEKEMAVAEPTLVAPFIDHFEKTFALEPGEYVASLSIAVEPGSASYVKNYRFTLFESDIADLRKFVEGYKYGGGIHFNMQEHAPIWVQLTEDRQSSTPKTT